MLVRTKKDLEKLLELVFYTKENFNINLKLIASRHGDNIEVSPIDNDLYFNIDCYTEITSKTYNPICVFNVEQTYGHSFKMQEYIRKIQDDACTCVHEDEEDDTECNCCIPTQKEAKEILYNKCIDSIVEKIKKELF